MSTCATDFESENPGILKALDLGFMRKACDVDKLVCLGAMKRKQISAKKNDQSQLVTLHLKPIMNFFCPYIMTLKTCKIYRNNDHVQIKNDEKWAMRFFF